MKHKNTSIPEQLMSRKQQFFKCPGARWINVISGIPLGAINILANAGHQNSDFDGTKYPTPLVMSDGYFYAT